jgi:hypothetical protein
LRIEKNVFYLDKRFGKHSYLISQVFSKNYINEHAFYVLYLNEQEDFNIVGAQSKVGTLLRNDILYKDTNKGIENYFEKIIKEHINNNWINNNS